MRRRIALVAGGVAAATALAVLEMAGTGSSVGAFVVTTPTVLGCQYSVSGPDVTVHTLPTPGVSKTGGVSESVYCP